MPTIWTEEEVTLDTLYAHMQDAGLTPAQPQGDRIMLRTESGIAYSVSIEDQRKFVRIVTYLPVDGEQSRECKLEFEHRLNRDVFMPSFSIDEENDLAVSYVMTYHQGLIAGQFMSVLIRFASMLEYVVSERNEEGVILLGPKHRAREDEFADIDNLGPARVTLLN